MLTGQWTFNWIRLNRKKRVIIRCVTNIVNNTMFLRFICVNSSPSNSPINVCHLIDCHMEHLGCRLPSPASPNNARENLSKLAEKPVNPREFNKHWAPVNKHLGVQTADNRLSGWVPTTGWRICVQTMLIRCAKHAKVEPQCVFLVLWANYRKSSCLDK